MTFTVERVFGFVRNLQVENGYILQNYQGVSCDKPGGASKMTMLKAWSICFCVWIS